MKRAASRARTSSSTAASSDRTAMSAAKKFTLFPLPPAQFVAGKSQAELAALQLPSPRPMPAMLSSNPALAQARIVEQVFTVDECEKIIAIGIKRPREDARVQSYGNAARVGHVAWVNQAVQFELLGFADALQYTSYGPGHKFDWHVDIGAGQASNRKVSITVQLSDESAYQGGALQFIGAPEMGMPKGRGTAILFPSYLAHRV